MNSAKPFSAVFQEWTEISMHHSMRDFKSFMDDSGLSPSQVSTLMRLYYRGVCGMSDVASDLGITNAAASQMVERLVQMGLLERSENPLDRRGKQLALTAEGRSLVERGIDARRCWMENLVATLSPEQQAQVSDALILLTNAARALDVTSK